jgi:GTP-binding protein HflX
MRLSVPCRWFYSRAILVSVQLPGVTDAETATSLVEMRRLAETLGHEVDEEALTQRRTSLGATVVGKGKLEELTRLRERSLPSDPVVVLVDTERLTKTQEASLAAATGGAQVMDRSKLILTIFKQHARTRAAKVQVEMAELMSGMGGPVRSGVTASESGGGGKGAGEKQTELTSRQVRDRMALLRRELEAIEKEEVTRRERRDDVAKVAIVGYTNAGKSSLMRALTGSDVLVEDKLFATLSTTSRVLRSPADWNRLSVPRILVSDTVGFIRKLPTELVASFAATLAEAADADALLHVCDASDPDWRAQMQVTEEVLQKTGAGEVPRMVVFNKVDLLTDAAFLAQLKQQFPEALFVSALEEADVRAVAERVTAVFEACMTPMELALNYDDPKRGLLLGKVRATCKVLEEFCDEETGKTHLKLLVPRHLAMDLKAKD